MSKTLERKQTEAVERKKKHSQLTTEEKLQKAINAAHGKDTKEIRKLKQQLKDEQEAKDKKHE